MSGVADEFGQGVVQFARPLTHFRFGDGDFFFDSPSFGQRGAHFVDAFVGPPRRALQPPELGPRGRARDGAELGPGFLNGGGGAVDGHSVLVDERDGSGLRSDSTSGEGHSDEAEKRDKHTRWRTTGGEPTAALAEQVRA